MGLLYGAKHLTAGDKTARYEAGFVFLHAGSHAFTNNGYGHKLFGLKTVSDAASLDLFRC